MVHVSRTFGRSRRSGRAANSLARVTFDACTAVRRAYPGCGDPAPGTKARFGPPRLRRASGSTRIQDVATDTDDCGVAFAVQYR